MAEEFSKCSSLLSLQVSGIVFTSNPLNNPKRSCYNLNGLWKSRILGQNITQMISRHAKKMWLHYWSTIFLRLCVHRTHLCTSVSTSMAWLWCPPQGAKTRQRADNATRSEVRPKLIAASLFCPRREPHGQERTNARPSPIQRPGQRRTNGSLDYRSKPLS